MIVTHDNTDDKTHTHQAESHTKLRLQAANINELASSV